MALLRGINVGGKNRLPMKDLVALFEDAGAEDVQTYIQSGNVVYRASASLAKRIPAVIGEALAEEAGLEIPVVTRTARELKAVAEGNPFLRQGVDLGVLHVGFLSGKPTAARVKSLEPDRSPPDAFEVRGREIYMRCPNGMARTKLTTAYFDSRLRLVTTVRNWRTVLKLVALSGG